MDLNEKIDLLKEYQEKAEELKNKMDTLKAEIIENMEENYLVSVNTPSGYKASLVYKDNIKYSDEPAIIKYCEENNLNNYIIKKVNVTALNKDLKKSSTLHESLKSYYTVSKTKVLTIKEG